MKLYGYELEPFMEFLYGLKLMDRQSRMRTRLLRLLGERQHELQQDYADLLGHYADKDADGRILEVETEDGGKGCRLQDPAAFEQAYRELLEEELVIDASAERLAMLESVRDAVLGCGIAFEGAAAVQYDRWAEIVEQLADACDQ
ncbi:DUF1617 family protein [Paenibacillus sp. IB182496]|uniref:DUF1617 family protein n=1 Tax=Paenibacillus sabuli TaxID=2772509 RepID=A0A927BVD8_9BACL|nr:DUF1617 family protein [Paenibacillus sabuli]MBD2846440.1 DUF1617 family protein [Paenibacillus sabuli]